MKKPYNDEPTLLQQMGCIGIVFVTALLSAIVISALAGVI